MRSPAQSALRFTASSPAAVVLTVWPSGTGELATVRAWLEGAAARIVHEQPVPLKTQLAELLMVMALYEGEEWVETNCWYSEQPLPTGAPEGPYAGAKWKRALCFRNAASREPHCFVLDTALCSTSLWADKYRLRAKLARESGNPGNSCVHLTDNQAGVLARRGAASSTSGGLRRVVRLQLCARPAAPRLVRLDQPCRGAAGARARLPRLSRGVAPVRAVASGTNGRRDGGG